MIGDIRRVLLVPHINIQNANALSSPFTIGFPAMTAWLGAAHALQRKLNCNGLINARFNKVAVISHHLDLQTHKGFGDYIYSIVGRGNPLDKGGGRSAFIEEARCHMDVSLVIEYSGINKDDEDPLIAQVIHQLNVSMKIAGGDILAFKNPSLHRVEEGNDAELREFFRKIMPGHAIVERRELMIEAMNQGQDAMDALLDYLAVHYHCEQEDNHITWTGQRKTTGWIVPIATGFHGISELDPAKNQRDPESPHRFAESVVTLGEFRMLHSIRSFDEVFWHYQADLKNNLYLCQQSNQTE
jgi:CRISPR-associated protein Csy2